MRLIPLLAMIPTLASAQVEQGPANADFAPAFEAQTRAPALPETAVTVTRFAEGLDTPWGIAALPDGGYLVTERSGALRRVGPDGAVSEPISGVPEVDARRQGGLLDVVVGPDFETDRRVWITYAKRVRGGTVTAAATGTLSADGTLLEDMREIFEQSPPSPNPMHFGSRIVLDPGGENAFITLGEHFTPQERVLAQDLGTTYGKVVRVDALDGAPPADNPFSGQDSLGSIWSYGHRNPQGAALDGAGQLWVLEHGPRGGDELNRIEPGVNYGWPVISYGINYNGSDVGGGIAVAEGMAQPVYYWDPVIAPGGLTFYDGDAFDWEGDALASGLVAQSLVRLRIEDGQVVGEERIAEGVGRVRDVEVAGDGSVLILIDAPAPFGEILRLTPQ
ncbi:MAG: glucose/sorbosone dehydrogenase family protein [Rhodobacteraceae bacterium HLUCCA08]|nr:MAG: glucose/sorbosone dehydrogenase family protein [Rhodobacteraceae bacterium HLUCCA08]